MPITAADIKLKFTFNEAANPPVLVVEDITDWLALGIDLAANPLDVMINLKATIEASTGPVVFYDNTPAAPLNPDIVTGQSVFNTTTIPLPLDAANAEVVRGGYTFDAVVCIYPDQPGEIRINASFGPYQYDLDSPCMVISYAINCLSSTLTTRDETNYDQYASSVTVSRVHTQYPPGGAEIAGVPLLPLTTPNATLIYNFITSGNWAVVIKSTVTWVTSEGLVIVRLIQGRKDITVSCETDINQLLCCLWAFSERLSKLWGENSTEYANKRERLAEIAYNMGVLTFAMHAGCQSIVADALTKIKKLTGCGNCACDSTQVRPIIPIIPNANTTIVVVDSPLGTVQVVPQLVGNTQYYHLEVSPALIQIINNLKPVVVDTQTPTYLTVIPQTVLGITTYHVNFTGNIPVMPNSIALWIRLSAVGGTWTAVVLPEFIRGVNMDVFANHLYHIGGNANFPPNATDADPAVIRYKNFQIAGGYFSVHAQLNNAYFSEDENTIKTFYQNSKAVEAEVFWTDAAGPGNTFDLRLYNPVTGQALILGDLPKNNNTDPTTSNIIIAVLINGNTP